ncbi:hypothetical protein ACH4UT_28580 [Streptomyces sp. NPDC020799]|uniref:hypothetical protein n=1 Tax=unclassified Streptomyces TaxID=2593676 RepID=UPI0033FE828B
MSENRVVNNKLDGHVGCFVLQAGIISGVSMSFVRNVTQEVRLLNVMAKLYRMLSSLTALAAIRGAKRGGTPLGGAANACEALALPSDWAVSTARRVAERAELVGGLALILLVASLLALPKPSQMGWDLGQTMEWRGPSAAVFSFSVLVQCGYMRLALLVIGIFAAIGIVTVSVQNNRSHRAHHVLVAVGSITFAMFFAPLYVLVWLLGRDVGVALYTPADT